MFFCVSCMVSACVFLLMVANEFAVTGLVCVNVFGVYMGIECCAIHMDMIMVVYI